MSKRTDRITPYPLMANELYKLKVRFGYDTS